MLQFGPDSVRVFGFAIRYYGALIALGALAGVLLAGRREQRLGLPHEISLDLALISLPLAILGARIYYIAFRWEFYRNDLKAMLDLRGGGLAIYGGILGGILGGWIVSRYKKCSFLRLADLAAPSVALGQAFGRWGNFFNQEAFGGLITDPKRMHFPVGVYITAEGAWHYATFFYESVWCFCIVLALLIAERHGSFRKKGSSALAYAFLYALERSCVEGLRTDSLWWGPFRVSQALSALVLLLTAGLLALRYIRKPLLRIPACLPALAVCVLVPTGFISSTSPAAFLLYILTLAAALILWLPHLRDTEDGNPVRSGSEHP